MPEAVIRVAATGVPLTVTLAVAPLKVTVLAEVVGEPRVKPRAAPLLTVIGDVWLPPTSARVPAVTVVAPV